MRLVKLNTRLLCALIVIALIAEAAGLAWLYLKYEDLGGRYRYTTWSIAIKSMRYLKSEIELLLYLLDNNPDIHLMEITARNAAEHSTVAATALLVLHTSERDLKIYVLHVALSNLEVYLNSFANNPSSERIASLRENKELLEEVTSIFGEIIMTYHQSPNNVRDSLVSRLREIS